MVETVTERFVVTRGDGGAYTVIDNVTGKVAPLDGDTRLPGGYAGVVDVASPLFSVVATMALNRWPEDTLATYFPTHQAVRDG